MFYFKKPQHKFIFGRVFYQSLIFIKGTHTHIYLVDPMDETSYPTALGLPNNDNDND
jgi:hypothetical protein